MTMVTVKPLVQEFIVRNVAVHLKSGMSANFRHVGVAIGIDSVGKTYMLVAQPFEGDSVSGRKLVWEEISHETFVDPVAL